MKLDDINKFILDRIEAAKIILEKEILLDHDFKDFEYTSAKIMNVLRNTKIEYSFIDNDDNGFMKFKDKLMKTMLNDSFIKSQFIKCVRGRRIEWNKDECKRWLKVTRAFLERMIIAIHIAYDQSMRVEELAIVMIKNQINGMRGLY